MILALVLLAGGVQASEGDATADETADETADWGEQRQGAHFMLGGGMEVFAFTFYPSAGVGYVEPSLNVGLSDGVDFRLSGMVGVGGGMADGGYGVILPGARPALRFHVLPRYTIWIGFSGRAGLVVEDEPALLPLYGPEISLASFRFGDRGQLEFDHDGGVFLPPIFAVKTGFVARYLY